jgi:hypothetical protein
MIIAFILYEKQKETSYWQPFINIIPDPKACPVTWEEEKIEEFKIESAVEQLRQRVKKMERWESWKGFFARYSDCWRREPLIVPLCHCFNYDNVLVESKAQLIPSNIQYDVLLVQLINIVYMRSHVKGGVQKLKMIVSIQMEEMLIVKLKGDSVDGHILTIGSSLPGSFLCNYRITNIQICH